MPLRWQWPKFHINSLDCLSYFRDILRYRNVLWGDMGQTVTWSCESPPMTSPAATPCCHCFVICWNISCRCSLSQQLFEAFVSLYKVHFYSQWRTKWIKAYSSLKARSSSPRDSHHLSATAFVFCLRLESQAFVMEVQVGGEVFLLLSLSSSFRRACQNTVTADLHRLSKRLWCLSPEAGM